MKYPEYKICEHDENEDMDECQEEHNPFPGYEHHHYGCECDGCLDWYRSLKW